MNKKVLQYIMLVGLITSLLLSPIMTVFAEEQSGMEKTNVNTGDITNKSSKESTETTTKKHEEIPDSAILKNAQSEQNFNGINNDIGENGSILKSDESDGRSFVSKEELAMNSAQVIVKYVDSEGKEVHAPQIISGNTGDSYDATTETYKLVIDGYTVDESKLPSHAKGTLSEESVELVYVYNQDEYYEYDMEVPYYPLDFKKLTISVPIPEKHLNKDLYFMLYINDSFTYYKTNEILSKITQFTWQKTVNSQNIISFSAQNFVVSSKNVNNLGFTMKINYTDVNTKQHIIVTYNIKFINGFVEVVYKDDKGNTIHPGQSIEGSIGDKFDATTSKYKLAIPGYSLDESQLPANAKGTLSNQKQTITYIYNKAPIQAKDL
ncbi:TPA_asm: hypothetical protein GIH59_12835, partial [Listeria monocytogenes]|nr:hypothetical protein [Listeria monocytogenes]